LEELKETDIERGRKIMPAGISWGKYVRFAVAAFGSMFAGSTCVHWYYKPKLEIPESPPDLASIPSPGTLISFKSSDP